LSSGRVVAEDSFELGEFLLVEGVFIANVLRTASVLVVVGDKLDKLGEVVAVPFAHTHGEEVDVLVELVEESNGLDDHIVDTVDVEF